MNRYLLIVESNKPIQYIHKLSLLRVLYGISLIGVHIGNSTFKIVLI